jgi:translation initiation factor IF-2
MELAKELGMDNKTAIAKLAEVGVPVKNHFNALTDTEAEKLRAAVRSGKSPEKAGSPAGSRVIIRRRAAEESPASATETPEQSQAEPAAQPKVLIRRRPEATAETLLPPAAADGIGATPAAESKQTEHHDLESKSSATHRTTSAASPSAGAEKVAPAAAAEVSPSTQELNSPSRSQSTEQVGAANIQSESVSQSDATTANIQTEPIASRIIARASAPAGNTQTPSSSSTDSAGPSSGATIVRRAPEREAGAVIVRRGSPSTSPSSQPQNSSYTPNNSQYGRRPGPGSSQGDGYRSPPRYGGNSSSDDRNNREARGPYVARPERTGPGGSSDYRSGGPGRGPGSGAGGRPGPGGPSGGFRSGYGGPGGAPRSGEGPGGPGSRFGGGRPGGDEYPRRGGDSSFRGGPASPPTDALAGRAEIAGRTDRSRDREKDKEKRKIHSEEENQKRVKLKGTSEEDDLVFIDPDDEEADVAGVRNFIPQRRRSSGRRKDQARTKEAINPMRASKRIVRIDDSITVSSLAAQMSVKSSAVIKSLMSLGVLASVNQHLDNDTAILVAQEFGFEVQNVAKSIGDILSTESHTSAQEDAFEQITRAPVVTIMGHVDHGKTSLLDALRETNKTATEAGGITQHIGAYRVVKDGRAITFIDTPGHAAFTEMRARGAKVTDVVILVVAADDGVMPQTVEAINHAKSAGVPVVVAVNKIDKPAANYDRILAEMASHGITAEEWGGESIFVKVSALTKQGLGDLLDAVLLQAEVLDLRARTEGLAEGVVIESRLDKARGPVATFLVNKGILRKGETIVAGKCAGRVRALFDDLGVKIEAAYPGVPVEVLGLDTVPSAGDTFNVVANDSVAKQAVQYRVDKDRKERAAASAKTNIQELLAQLGTDHAGKKELPLIVKADTHGSVEAIRNALEKLGTDQVVCKVVHAAVGGITETDVSLASAAHALVVGFNVRPDRKSSEVAEEHGVDIKTFSIIYELIDTIELAMAGKLEPIRHERVQGHAEVRNLFSVPKIGIIAGCSVTDGKISRNAHIRVVRDSIVLFTGRIGSLKRFKEDAKEVTHGYECGIGVENYNDLKVGDVLECFIIEEVAATLRPTGATASGESASSNN